MYILSSTTINYQCHTYQIPEVFQALQTNLDRKRFREFVKHKCALDTKMDRARNIQQTLKESLDGWLHRWSRKTGRGGRESMREKIKETKRGHERSEEKTDRRSIESYTTDRLQKYTHIHIHTYP